MVHHLVVDHIIDKVRGDLWIIEDAMDLDMASSLVIRAKCAAGAYTATGIAKPREAYFQSAGKVEPVKPIIDSLEIDVVTL